MAKLATTTVAKLKTFAEAAGFKVSLSEYTDLVQISDPQNLPEPTAGKNSGSYYLQMADGWRLAIKTGADVDDLSGLVQVCKFKELEFLVVS